MFGNLMTKLSGTLGPGTTIFDDLIQVVRD